MTHSENEWIDDITNNLDIHNDDLKPSIANLRFENNQSPFNSDHCDYL